MASINRSIACTACAYTRYAEGEAPLAQSTNAFWATTSTSTNDRTAVYKQQYAKTAVHKNQYSVSIGFYIFMQINSGYKTAFQFMRATHRPAHASGPGTRKGKLSSYKQLTSTPTPHGTPPCGLHIYWPCLAASKI